MKFLSTAETAYIEAHNLLPLLTHYSNPRDYLARLVRKGDLIRLKNGFYVIAAKIEQGVPFEQIANLLYGPSYISFEWALSFYGMIPEGVYVVSSASAIKSKTYQTPLGTFDYIFLGSNRYSIGITQNTNTAGNFLIASPEKALVDLVHFKSRHLNQKELLVDLIEGRRIEESVLRNLDKKSLAKIADQYRSKSTNNLIQLLGLV